ncbi:MAG: hypothetical protein Kow0029_02110 [Candidatus Rifleibacteriota bacterium]
MGSGDSNPVSGNVQESGEASLSFNFVLPENGDNLPGNAAIRGATDAQVKIILTVRQPGSSTNKPFTILKTYPVTSSEIQVSMTGLPTGVVIAKIRMENAHIQGWTDFQGATDLVTGANNVEVSPAGSKLPADLLASVLQEAINNDSIMAAGSGSMVTNLKNAIGSVDVNSENPYGKVLEILVDQLNPPGMIKVSFDNTTNLLTGTNGTNKAWEISYHDPNLLGTGQVFGVETSAIKAVRVIRQGFDTYSLVEWRDPASLLSIVVNHSNANGEATHYFMNKGIIDQVIPLTETEYLISGYNMQNHCPAVWKWNIGKDSYTDGLNGAVKNLEWEKLFTDAAYSSDPAAGGSVPNLMVDGAGNITAVIKLPTGVIRTYSISSTGVATSLTPITTTPNRLPTVSLTAPAEGSSYTTDQTVTIIANPSDSDGTISMVEFFAGSTLIGTVNSEPWSYSWSGMTADSYTIVARATDNAGFSKLSSPVNITITQATVNQAPIVSITSPTGGATYNSGQTVEITASASDPDGSITKVEFYNGTTLLGSDDTSPYTYSWVSVAAGSYSLMAKAYDNLGETTDSGIVSITVNAAPTGTGPELMISEVSSSQYSNSPRWFEVINKSTSDIDLSNYKARTLTIPSGGGTIAAGASFSLPSLTVSPGNYAVIRVKTSDDLYDGPALVNFAGGEPNIPYWGEFGFIEIIKASTGSTVDYVKFGNVNDYFPSENPTTSTEWTGAAAAAMPDAEGYALVRDLNEDDNNSATNWTLRAHTTPAAINDVISDTDTDGDGIPDENESPGKTYCGLPYYDWGARAGTTDIFVHIDYMDTTGLSTTKALAMTPREEALTRIKAAFQAKGIAIHFDAGTLFGTTPDKYCLDGRSHKVTYSQKLNLSPVSGAGNAYQYKAASMPLNKLPVFHYCLIGDLPYGSFSGLGELSGNDFIVVLGNSSFSDSSSDDLNYLNYEHAATLMHELGHNLGLRHGGDVDDNYKPNYISIMNYMYSNYGLPVKGDAKEGDRYYYYRFSTVDGKSTSSAFKQYFPNGWWNLDMHNTPMTDTVIMDFSNGTSGTINEASISEAAGLGRGGSPVDFNGNGNSSDSGLSMDLDNDGSIKTMTDFNDWAQIKANFSRYISGVASIRYNATSQLPPRKDYLTNDYQEVIPCNPVEPYNCDHDH